MEDDRFTVRWDLHKDVVLENFENMYSINAFTDCILVAGEREIHAHKVILSSCSAHFRKLFEKAADKVPMIIFHDVTFEELRALVDYMYRGEVIVNRCTADRMLKIGKDLKVQGFLEKREPKNVKEKLPINYLYGKPQDYPMQSYNGWTCQNLLSTEQTPVYTNTPIYRNLVPCQNFPMETPKEQNYPDMKLEGFLSEAKIASQGFNGINIQPSQALAVLIPRQPPDMKTQVRNVTKRRKDGCSKSINSVKKKTKNGSNSPLTPKAEVGEERQAKIFESENLLELIEQNRTEKKLNDATEILQHPHDFQEPNSLLTSPSPIQTEEALDAESVAPCLSLPPKIPEETTGILKPSSSLEDINNLTIESEPEESDHSTSISVYTDEGSQVSFGPEREENTKKDEHDKNSTGDLMSLFKILCDSILLWCGLLLFVGILVDNITAIFISEMCLLPAIFGIIVYTLVFIIYFINRQDFGASFAIFLIQRILFLAIMLVTVWVVHSFRIRRMELINDEMWSDVKTYVPKHAKRSKYKCNDLFLLKKPKYLKPPIPYVKRRPKHYRYSYSTGPPKLIESRCERVRMVAKYRPFVDYSCRPVEFSPYYSRDYVEHVNTTGLVPRPAYSPIPRSPSCSTTKEPPPTILPNPPPNISPLSRVPSKGILRPPTHSCESKSCGVNRRNPV